MHSFLNNIANVYATLPQVHTYTFVFPNVRSKRYFSTRLVSAGIDEYKAEQMCMTLAQLVEKGSGLKRVSSERLLFLLYRAYCDVSIKLADSAPKIQDFDNFRYWGQIILKDFSDVDSYMANPAEIFRNATDYKKIQSHYLTENQKRIIESYWGSDPFWNEPIAIAADELPFWNHVSPKGKTEKKFTRLWAILGPVYTRFRELLGNECYPGLAARVVAEKLQRGEDLRPFNPSLFIFIGFNRLSTAEHIIFEELDKRGRAHFYWDYVPELMSHGAGNLAGRFIAKYAQRFVASMPEVEPPTRPTHHQVDVIGVPSAVGQAKVAAEILRNEESAVVLPSDDMLLPMVASIPENFKNVNVTMGYPLRYSALAQLFSLLGNLQSHVAVTNGEAIFFRDDVRELITNPLIQSVHAEECRFIEAFMRKENLFNLPVSKITDGFGNLRQILKPLGSDAKLVDITDYIKESLTQLEQSGAITGMDSKCLDVIIRMIEYISELANENGITMSTATFFRLIERNVFRRSLPLEGESFEALQIMGVLETRALGFANVVMLSMNDSVFPGREFSRSFIPETLRQAYGLPTRDHHDVDAAYHFYHILSCAEHLTLIYDSRSGGLVSGEMSRFIFQLQYLDFPGVKLCRREATIGNTSPTLFQPAIPSGTSIPKTPRIMEKLKRFLDPQLCERFSLSASSLKEYLACPVQFLFQRVENINPPDELSDTMTAADYGNVIHTAAENIYNNLKEINGGIITDEMLRLLLDGKHENLLERELDKAINIYLNHVPAMIDDMENPAVYNPVINGEAEMYRDAFLVVLRNLFMVDISYTPFRMIAAEASETFHWKITDELSVNFTMKIDRIDSIEMAGQSVTRLVDYKTGNDKTDFKDIEQLFEIGNPEHPHAIFQLFTYALAYADKFNETPGSIMPQIYTLKHLNGTAFPLISDKTRKTPVTNFSTYESDFRKSLAKMLAEIFNPDVPFIRAENDKCCTFCKFYSFCHQQAKPQKK